MKSITLLLTLIGASSVFGQQRLVVEPASLTRNIDETAQLAATVYADDGQPVDSVQLRWFSPDKTIATVDRQGAVTAMGAGTVRITAIGAGVRGYTILTVNTLPPATLTASVKGGRIPAGVGMPLGIDVLDREGHPVDGVQLVFESLTPEVASVDARGRVTGLQPGDGSVRVSVGHISTVYTFEVVPNTATSYQLLYPNESVRTGDVIRFRVAAQDADGMPVASPTPVWAISEPGATIETEGDEGVFVAEQPGTYRVSALIGPDLVRSTLVTVAPRRYDVELVKVGRGGAAHHHSGDTWVYEGVDGRDYAIIGTFIHDWAKVWDVTDPSAPFMTDSLQVDARRINDVKIHPNNRLGIITREGASSRRNGMVFLDLSVPAHPTILSEYTETVTGGVHNVWIDGVNELVYAVHNGTSDMHIIDISDPLNPKEVGRWGVDNPRKSLHDVIVQDGYAYLSYWDDGAITLDVGAGTHGGTPIKPAFVSQFKYAMGNTHVAWRDGRYLFVGDEIFPDGWDADAPIEASGYIHVLDMTDIDNPVEVAKYEVPEAGAHNVWVEDGKLYIGYYQAGLRVVDITGELRGDLYRQGREMAALKTTDAVTTTPNWPMTWGAQIFKGHIFTSDLNSGLWIARLVEHESVP